MNDHALTGNEHDSTFITPDLQRFIVIHENKTSWPSIIVWHNGIVMEAYLKVLSASDDEGVTLGKQFMMRDYPLGAWEIFFGLWLLSAHDPLPTDPLDPDLAGEQVTDKIKRLLLTSHELYLKSPDDGMSENVE